MLLTIKRKINITQEQKELLWKTSNEATQLYNNLLQEKNHYYEQTQKYLGYYTQQKRLKDYPCEYLTYDMKKEICRTLDNNYKSFFTLLKKNKELNPQPPKYRSKKYFFTLSFVQDFIIENGILKLSNKNSKYIKIPFNYDFEEDSISIRNKSKSILKTCKVFYDDVTDNFYTCIVKQNEIPQEKGVGKYLAIDLGKKNIVTYYDEPTNTACVFNSSAYYKNEKYYDKRIDELKQKMKTKIKGSIKWNKLNKKKRQLYKKKDQQNKLSLHKLSKEISKFDRDIIIGELTNLKRNTLSDYKKQNRECQNNWQLMTFVNLLEYKCKKEGRKLTKVNEAWTSKTCFNCGTIDYDLTPANRVYKCEHCGMIINRDVNGSINILKVYKQHMGVYSTPHDVKTSERFFGNVQKTNRFCINLKEII